MGARCNYRIQLQPTTIPFIGCFSLEPGTQVEGVLEGMDVRIEGTKAPAALAAVFLADGKAVSTQDTQRTNDPRVRVRDNEYEFCSRQDLSMPSCAVRVTVLGTRGGSLLLVVSRRGPKNIFIDTQD